MLLLQTKNNSTEWQLLCLPKLLRRPIASTRFNKIEISKTRKIRINWMSNATWRTVKKARSTPETWTRSPISSSNSWSV